MGPFLKYRNLESPPDPPVNDGVEKRTRAALASQTFSSTLIGGQGGRTTKVAQSNQCGRSLDRDAHQISHSVHLFSHFFATIDCNQNQRHLGGDSHTNDSHCNSIFGHYCPVLKERSQNWSEMFEKKCGRKIFGPRSREIASKSALPDDVRPCHEPNRSAKS